MRDVASDMRPWVVFLARAGFAARGVLSCTIGVLATMAALGSRHGETTDSKGALAAIHDQPFGKVLLAIVAVGLFGHALWLFLQAVVDPERTARKPKTGPLLRAGRVVAGVIHLALGVYAVGLVTGVALGSEEDGTKSWTARLLGWDGIGVALVAAFGLFVVGLGVFDVWKAARSSLDKQLDLSRVRGARRTWTIQICRFGIAARAFVFVVIGAFLVVAAVRTNPNDAKGLGDALAAIQGFSLGWLLLSVVALGFVAYGVYQLVEARYRRIPTS